jgi:protein-S-isoprenylcysteine O-methyltransferase Ste14
VSDILEDTPQQISEAELRPAAQIGGVLFRHRSWLPLPLLGIPLNFPGHQSVEGWIIGGIFIVVGELFRLWGVAAAGNTTRRRSRNVSELVTHGAFAWSRNPLYNGNFLIWMGFVIISGVLWFLPAAMLLFAAEYSFIVRYEEGVLESTFGREYLEYKLCTPRWVPSAPKLESSGNLDWAGALHSERSSFLQYFVLIIAFIVKEKLANR